MKSPFPLLIITTALPLLAVSTLFGQTAGVRAGAANKGEDEAPANTDAKEKAEDAARLEELDAQAHGYQSKTVTRDQWAPDSFSRAGGGMGGMVPAGVPYHVQNLLTRPVDGGKALLVRTTEPEPKTQAQLQEDLTVMSHLLNKAIEELPGGQGTAPRVMGIDVFYTASAPLRSLYLDNYGAVFFLNVSFPLVAPAEKRAEEKPAADSAWEDARQELYGQRMQGTFGGEPAEEYSQEKVDKLKETLLEALKNASNIRDLKPDEFVTVSVAGGGSGGSRRYRVIKHNPPGTLGGNVRAAEQPLNSARRTILTIRVSKADIDSYSSGKLSSEEFQKHARITAYTSDPIGGASEGLFIGGASGKARF